MRKIQNWKNMKAKKTKEKENGKRRKIDENIFLFSLNI